jgi:ABC-type nitrate/sulfonate/bicarbonate transport system substrate-binding protein
MGKSRMKYLAVAAVAAAVSVAAIEAGAEDKPAVIASYWQQTTPLPETILATQPSLQATIPATMTFRAITSGPAALAAMKAGAFDFVGGVGNPPVLSAIANQTNMKVVWAQYYDFGGFAVQGDIKVPEGLVGQQLAQMPGSSQAFSFYGWLKNRDLIGKVKLVNMTPEAMLAAFKSKAIAGGFVSEPIPTLMIQSGGKMVVSSADMAKEGYPGIGMVVAKADLVKDHPEIVQAYVCALAKAQTMVKGPDAVDVLNKAGAYNGGQPNSDDVVRLGAEWPYWPMAEEMGPLGMGTADNPGSGVVAQALYKTGLWMKDQGKIENPPSQETVTSFIDASFAQNVIDHKCPQ